MVYLEIEAKCLTPEIRSIILIYSTDPQPIFAIFFSESYVRFFKNT